MILIQNKVHILRFIIGTITIITFLLLLPLTSFADISGNDNVLIEEILKNDQNSRQIIENAGDKLLNLRDKEGNTILHLALMDNKNDLAEIILEKYPSLIDVENLRYETPIFVADKYENMDGVKLCLEYLPLHKNSNNNCFKIFEKVRGTEPYYLNKKLSRFIPSSNETNNDKLVILLRLPDFAGNFKINRRFEDDYYFSIPFTKSNVTILEIGNGVHSLSYQLIKKSVDSISLPLPKKVILIIHGHGMMDQDGDHITFLDNTSCHIKTRDLFRNLGLIFKDKPIEVLSTACFGGGAIKDVDLLPKGSSLLVLAQKDRESAGIGAICRQEDYELYPEKFSLRHFLMLFLVKSGVNNIPELAISGGKKEFDYIQLGQYLGYKLSDEQKDTIVNKLLNYCVNYSHRENCLGEILDAFNKIENAKSIDDLKEPETLKEDYFYCKFYPLENYSGRFCIIDPFPSYKELIEYDLLSPSTTDQDICRENFNNDNLMSKCLWGGFIPQNYDKQFFQLSLAILYEIKRLVEGV